MQDLPPPDPNCDLGGSFRLFVPRCSCRQSKNNNSTYIKGVEGLIKIIHVNCFTQLLAQSLLSSWLSNLFLLLPHTPAQQGCLLSHNHILCFCPAALCSHCSESRPPYGLFSSLMKGPFHPDPSNQSQLGPSGLSVCSSLIILIIYSNL